GPVLITVRKWLALSLQFGFRGAQGDKRDDGQLRSGLSGLGLLAFARPQDGLAASQPCAATDLGLAKTASVFVVLGHHRWDRTRVLDVVDGDEHQICRSHVTPCADLVPRLCRDPNAD